MLDRVASLIGGAADGMWLGTFHAIGVRVLRRHAELVGLKSNFTILDTDDQTRLIKQLLQAEGIDDKKWPARVLSRHHPALEGPRAHARQGLGRRGRRVRRRQGGRDLPPVPGAPGRGERRRFRRPRHALRDPVAEASRRAGACIIAASATSWSTSTRTPTWRSICGSGCWRRAREDVCCVGDDDQSIYGWRGAEVGNILRFEKDFPGATIVRLERNYRSTPHILAAASHLISHNEGRLGKTLWTEMKEGERISLRGVWDGDEEARTHRRGDRGAAARQARARADRHPGARRLPDPRVRGTLHHHGPALPRDRRPALLRAPGDPRRAGLLPRHRAARRRSRLRAHLQHAAPRASANRRCARCGIIQRSQKISLFEATRRALETDELQGPASASRWAT